MTKYYYEVQQIRQTYHHDKRKAYEEKYVRRRWETIWDTEDFNEITDWINGQGIEGWNSDGSPRFQSAPNHYRILRYEIIDQKGECVSPFDDAWEQCQNSIKAAE